MGKNIVNSQSSDHLILDAKDRRLLLALFENGRATTTALAKKIGVSQEVANYRLSRLKKTGLLKRVIPIINLAALGYDTFRLQLRFGPMNEATKEKFVAQAVRTPQLSWFVRLAGPWDVVLLFSSQSIQEFSKIYNELIDDWGTHIDEKLLTIVTKIQHFPPTFLLGGTHNPLIVGTNTQRHALEPNQAKILKQLLFDGRKPLLEIARETSLSMATVKYHVELLQKRNVLLGFRPLLDYKTLQYDYFKVTIELQNPNERQQLEQRLLANNNIVYITESLGKYDLEFECCFLTVEELLACIESLKRTVHIQSYEIIFRNEELIVNAIPEVEQ